MRTTSIGALAIPPARADRRMRWIADRCDRQASIFRCHSSSRLTLSYPSANQGWLATAGHSRALTPNARTQGRVNSCRLPAVIAVQGWNRKCSTVAKVPPALGAQRWRCTTAAGSPAHRSLKLAMPAGLRRLLSNSATAANSPSPVWSIYGLQQTHRPFLALARRRSARSKLASLAWGGASALAAGAAVH